MAKTIGVILSLKDAFTPNIKKAAKELNITEKELKSATKEVQKFQSQCAEAAKKVAIGLVAAATTATVAMYNMVQGTAAAGDRVDKLSQKVGMGRVAFQEWDYIMSQNGGNVESLKMGYKTLASQMEMVTKGNKDSIGYFKKLGVSIKDNTGNLRSQDEVFNDTIKALQKMPNPTEKAIVAQKLLGKSALELKPLLNQSAESVDKLRQKAHDCGMIMSDEAVDAAVLFTDTMDTLNRTFQGIGYQVGSVFMPIFQELAQKAQANMPKIKAVALDVANDLIAVTGFLSNNMHNIIPVIGAVVSSFAAFKVVYSVISGIKTLMTVIRTVTLLQGAWNAVLLANPIGLVAGGIALLVGILVFLQMRFQLLTKIGNGFMYVLRGIRDGFLLVVKAVGDFISKIGKAAHIWKTGFKGGGPKEPKLPKEPKGKPDNSSADEPLEPPPLPHNALGTNNFSGGQTYMNEGGKGEIAVLPKGSVIYPHDLSKKMVGNKSIVFSPKIIVQGNLLGNEQYADMLISLMFSKLKIALANT